MVCPPHAVPTSAEVLILLSPTPRRYPNGFAWSLKAPRQAIRKQEAFKKFQHFLVHEADVGNISRQEAVSMIPPLLLDVQPHHYVRPLLITILGFLLELTTARARAL